MVADARAVQEKRPAPKINADVERQFRGSWSGFERDKFFYNPDGPWPRFFDASYVLDLDFDDDGRAAVPVDIDGDGDLDLALLSLQGLRLMENRAAPRRFARVRLEATRSHASAIGSVVRLRAGGVTQQDYVKSVDGFLSQVPLDLQYGLDRAEKVEEIAVTWPDGQVETWRDLPADRLIRLRQGDPAARDEALPAWPSESRPASAAKFSLSLRAPTLNGDPAPIAEPGLPVVINFWAPSCAPCKEELPALAALSRRLGAEARFTGVSTETADLTAVRKVVADFGLDYPQLLATDEVVRSFFGSDTRLPIPSTFVFDAAGRLRRVFRRPVRDEELEPLLASLRDEGRYVADITAQASHLLWRQEFAKARDAFREAARLRPEDPTIHLKIGLSCAGLEDYQGAVLACREAVRLDPAYLQGHYNLGIALRKLARPAEAIPCFEAILAVDPTDRRALLSLGAAAAEAGRTATSVEAFDRATRMDETWAEAWLGKGKSLLAAGQAEAALESLDRATRLDSTIAEAWLYRGKACFMLGRLEDARQNTEQALRLEPADAEARQFLGQIQRAPRK